MDLQRKWKIHIIHHTHTDIGYTQRQEKIIAYHKDFIKQAIDILNDYYINGNEDYKGFVWQCENHWQVKNFYNQADEAYIKDFEKYVRQGDIGLSGNYLNMTELVSESVLNSRVRQVKEYGESIGHPIRSGMAADVNGYAWGFADIFKDNGIENFFSCIHPHHGMFPLFKKQLPFYWVSPKGQKVLVWNGEYYHFGNELHLCPEAANTYMLYDDIHKRFRNEDTYRVSKSETEAEEMKYFEQRMERYLQNLEVEGYPYDFIPVMVSGALTDNAPPNGYLAQRVNMINEKYKGQLECVITTLDKFFEEVREKCSDIPEYSGDWNDWWADGVSSTPQATKIFRSAQRKVDLCKKLDPNGELGNKALLEEAEENLVLYAEHTWGYSSSVSEPWETMVGELELRKTAYASNGDVAISKNLDFILEGKGEKNIAPYKPQCFKIINPHNEKVIRPVKLYIDFWEYIDGVKYYIDTPIEVIDKVTGDVIPHQVKRIARAYEVEIIQELKGNEEKEVQITLDQTPQKSYTMQNHAHIGAEGVQDVILKNSYREDTEEIETDYFKIKLDEKNGIENIIDKTDGKSILRVDSLHPAFSGVYEITPIQVNPMEERRRMGRNRKSISTKRYISELRDIQVVENGPLFITIRLDYELVGTKMYAVFMKVYKQLKEIEFIVRIHKESNWEPENLYIAMPCRADKDAQQYIDKTGCIMRPGIDQLPGTNKEFYSLQNGIISQGMDKAVILTIKDTPLVVFGDLKAKPIELCNEDSEAYNQGIPYSWAMNNYWETNFKVDLAGFYEFFYTLTIQDGTNPEKHMKMCEMINQGIIAFPI